MPTIDKKINKTVAILFVIQTVLIVLGLAIQPDPALMFSVQWIAWTLAGIISLVIFFKVITMAINKLKYEKLTILATVSNIILLVIALYAHFNPTLG